MKPVPPAPPVPTIFYLHALGSSRRAIEAVAERLGADFEIVGIDLPGFGAAPLSIGTSVSAMADHVAGIISIHGAPRWLLAGHSMGGKIASIVAAQAMAGKGGLFGLAGVVLLAGSPPSPEPMAEERREDMLSWARDGALGEAAIRQFIKANVGAPLDPAADERAVADLRRTEREAWLAWLERGSREDWSRLVGRLDVPALILAGGADGDLGPEGQRQVNLPVYPRGRIEVLDGAGHLLPLERPAEVAEAILRFWREIAGTGPSIPADFARTIASPRVSARTRAIFAKRILADDPAYQPEAVSADELTTLRAVAARTVPQSGPAIDLAARVDSQLAKGQGDGWRFATMPPDVEAYRAALAALTGFEKLPPLEQDARLALIAEGEFENGGRLSGAQMASWFEDARTDLVRQWLAHPATMARIGFDGFANGGDAERKQGFDRLGAGEREGWEPVMEAAR